MGPGSSCGMFVSPPTRKREVREQRALPPHVSWLRLIELHQLAVVAVRVEERRDGAAPILLAGRPDELHALSFEALLLRVEVIDEEVEQHACRLLRLALDLAV